MTSRFGVASSGFAVYSIPRRPSGNERGGFGYAQEPPPNKRLKLAGTDRSKGNGVFAPWRARTVVQHPCAGGRVARSLSAIR